MIADLSFVEEWRFSLHPGVRSWQAWWYGPSWLRRAYLRLCDWVSPVSNEGWKRNVTLSNSEWTAQRIRQKYGLESQVLYPPVEGNFPSVPFGERENGFVCLGRITPEKRVDAIINILSRVRERGHNVHLHILGGFDASSYALKVKALAEQNQAWVRLEGWAVGDAKKRLLTCHRYGIHARENEPFGIAVAEMVDAGCIVFVPSGGGQVEIVNHPALLFEDESDAADKIEAVLTDPRRQELLRHHLQQNRARFSPGSFQSQIVRVVMDFLNEAKIAACNCSPPTPEL
jgi:glycosyltransferase involved in cell wall biosynthesis